jgi:serine/threonine-protein kinase
MLVASQLPTTPPRAAVAAMGPPVGRLVSSDSVPAGGFTPGSILADRYRIVGLLGRGGMGEVYRADDLKLGQAVALKFLPRALSDDPVRRERFFAEVRITRQVSHPNICRVYDIADVGGQHFLSMEYIDGEDLASLVTRIGHLSNEKALDIARQLASGLAAAHERGVLHRDLKPANVMIDGRGRVRITDFGLAVAVDDESLPGDTSGTPAYMAPEQLAGKGATVRSDIYAFGLILYEIYTGKRAFTAATLPELRGQKETATPAAPSELRPGIDPIVERLITRCLERDPRARPGSVAQVAAALPGGDPLAAALAAGETPSPEMVAASGLKEGLRPAIALGLVGLVVASVLAIVPMDAQIFPVQRVPASKPPAVLAERAREIVRAAGYASEPADTETGFTYDFDLIDHVRKSDRSPSRWSTLKTFGVIEYWYRQSPRPLERVEFSPLGIGARSRGDDPPMLFSGEVLVRLDPEGNLKSLEAGPPQVVSGPSGASPDWARLFAAAGLDITQWTSSPPRWSPRFFADSQRAWEGSLPGAPGVPLRVEAAAFQGAPVSFAIIAPWTPAARDRSGRPAMPTVVAWIFVGLLFVLSAGGLFFARRNLRLGRGDRRGAARLAGVTAILLAAVWVLWEHHVATFAQVYLLLMFVGSTLVLAGFTWTLYIALEPFVRRQWPHVLVTWTRLLSGDWRDPLVGRDTLIGCAAGVVFAVLIKVDILLPEWLGRPDVIVTSLIDPLGAPTPFASRILGTIVVTGILLPLAMVFLLFVLRLLVRRTWLAALIWLVVFSPSLFTTEELWAAGPLIVAESLLFLFVMMRVGLWALMVTSFVVQLWLDFPLTLQTSAWYAGAGYAALFILAAITLYGFRTSLGGRRLFEIADG